MSTENETMGELIADWRKGRPVTADQIHTAWVREREALLKRARDNYAAGFAKGREAAERQPGNVAALREALIKVLEYIESFHKYITPDKGKELTALFAVADTIRDKARAALAKPARNCDVLESYDEALDAWILWRGDNLSVHDGIGKAKQPFPHWLLAPAKEKEGGAK